jgi:hypothetical protein
MEPEVVANVLLVDQGENSPRIPMKFTLLQRLGRKLGRGASPDPWQFALAVREVMLVRIVRGISGRLTAEEARRMVLEKHSAGVRAHLAYLEWLARGNPAGAHRAAFDIYNRAVLSNRKRLRRRPWPWSM